MSNITQEILFPGSGLDSDSANVYKALADSEYRLNIVIGAEGTNGFIENMKGNRLAVYPLENSNVYQVNGGYYDQLTRNVYYWVFSQPHDFSSSGDFEYDNHLLCFNEDSETITNVFTDTHNYFGLDLWHPIKDADKIGNMLYFNPRVSEPKMIDVVRAKNYMDYSAWESSPTTYEYGDKVRFFGGVFLANRAIGVDESPSTHPTYWDRIGDSYQDETDIDFDSEFRYAFNVIRHVPVYRPECTYGSDLDKNANNVRRKLFRFTHRYKFFYWTYSLFGAYSDVTLPVNDEYYNGEIPEDLDLYNHIVVNLRLHSASLIKEIDLIFQEVGGDWKRAKLINRWEQELLDDLWYSYKFYNTESAYVVVDENLLKEIYDSVPRTAATQEFINKNILSYGRPKEGFTNIDKNDIDVTLTPEMEAIVIPNSVEPGGRFRDNIANDDWVLTWEDSAWKISLYPAAWFNGGLWASGDIFVIVIDGKLVSHTFTPVEVISLQSFCAAIGTTMIAGFPTLNISYNILSVYITTTSTSLLFGLSKFYQPSATPIASLTKKRGFKTGSFHPFCLFYYDEAMRRWDAQTSKDNIDGSVYSVNGTTVYVPMLNEISPTPTDTANRWIINWEVSHYPPLEAKWWRFGYAGNALCSYFVQYTINAIVDDAPWTTIDISPLQTLKTTTAAGWNRFPQSDIDPYTWIKGDRVRFITEKSAAVNMGVILDGVYDFEIVRYEETDDATVKYLIYIQDFDYATIDIGADTLIEIYRPLKTDTSIVYHEFGELMPVLVDSNGIVVHGCGNIGIQNQDSITGDSAQGVFDSGDVYHILRTPSKPIDTVTGYFHESQWYSDFYQSDDYDRGRIGQETSFGERTLNIIRYSNQYLQNTEINGLSTFEAKHYKELSDIYGNVVAMIEVGNTLKVYMDKKAPSVLIGRQEYQDADGKLTTASSEVVLGSVRYPENSFGTQWIESVVKNNRYVYGYDAYNAVFWRDSANGIFPISGRYEDAGQQGDYKMATWFKAKSDAILLTGIDNVKVISVWDEKYKLLYVTFIDHTDNNNNETIVYHEPSNRWIAYTEFDQTPVGGYNEMLELDYWVLKGFENGIGYFFNEDTRFAEFHIPVTTASIIAYQPKIDLTYTLFEPTFIGDMTYQVDVLPLQYILKEPTVHISYVTLSVDNFAWTGAEAGSGVADTFVITSSEDYVTVINMPSWITMVSSDGIVSIGDLIANGDTVSIYPTESNAPSETNIGDARSATFAFVRTTPFFDDASITVTQAAGSTAPIVVVDVDGRDTSGMTLTTGVGTATSGSPVINLSFTPDRPLHAAGGTFTMYWQATKNIGGAITQITYGSIANVIEEAVNAKVITLTENVTPLQVITVDLSSMDIYTGTPPASISAPIVSTITQPTLALATGSVLLTGLPASGTWSLLRSPDNVITTGTGTSTTISGLTEGSYSWTVTDSNNTTSLSSTYAIINKQPANITVITDLLNLTYTLFEPTVTISQIALSVTSFTWDANEAGTAVGINTVLSTTQPYATINSIASWLILEGEHGILSIGDVVYNGERIRIYPKESNTGAIKTATVALVINTPFLDTVSITVTHSATTADPIIAIYQDGGDTSGLTLSDMFVYASLNSPTVYISFLPDHPNHGIGGEFDMYYQITKDVGGAVEIINGVFTAYDEIQNNVTLTMPEVATAGMEYDVNLSASDIY